MQLEDWVIPITLNILAYWHRDRWLYIFAGAAFIILGVDYMSSNLYLGWLVMLVGVYDWFKAWLEKKRV